MAAIAPMGRSYKPIVAAIAPMGRSYKPIAATEFYRGHGPLLQEQVFPSGSETVDQHQ